MWLSSGCGTGYSTGCLHPQCGQDYYDILGCCFPLCKCQGGRKCLEYPLVNTPGTVPGWWTGATNPRGLEDRPPYALFRMVFERELPEVTARRTLPSLARQHHGISFCNELSPTLSNGRSWVYSPPPFSFLWPKNNKRVLRVLNVALQEQPTEVHSLLASLAQVQLYRIVISLVDLGEEAVEMWVNSKHSKDVGIPFPAFNIPIATIIRHYRNHRLLEQWLILIRLQSGLCPLLLLSQVLIVKLFIFALVAFPSHWRWRWG